MTVDYLPGDFVSFSPYNAYMVERYGATAILTGVVVRRNWNRAGELQSLTVNVGGVATVPLAYIL